MSDEQFVAGATFEGSRRTITDAEIAFLPALMGAINPLFHDELAAQAGPMGRRILYGPALLGISVGLTEALIHDRVMGLVEITSVRFRRPVFAGDTVHARFTVRDLVPREGRPGSLLSTDDEVFNQDDVLVLRFSRQILVADGRA